MRSSPNPLKQWESGDTKVTTVFKETLRSDSVMTTKVKIFLMFLSIFHSIAMHVVQHGRSSAPVTDSLTINWYVYVCVCACKINLGIVYLGVCVHVSKVTVGTWID